MPHEPAPAVLTDAQEKALERSSKPPSGAGGRFLLYGETGSGKTEVYLRACAAALERGLGAIVLVPEIALTPQAVARFRARFGDRVACLHSGLSEAERRDERERVAAGDARWSSGPARRSSPPCRRLGVVCVDEEHDPSYKQDADPRYDARTVAVRRAALERAVVRVRQRHAPAGELGAARAARRSAGASAARCRRCASSICAARAATRCRRRS